MTELTEIDIKLLKFVSKNEPVSMASIKEKFPKVSSIDYRVKLLSTPEYRRVGDIPISFPVENTSYLHQRCKDTQAGGITKAEPIDSYLLTEFGRKFLQDNIRKTRATRQELWLKNAWIPIVVAFITTVLTNYILPKLIRTLELSLHTLL